jgi:hypothetical protein
MTPAGLSGGTTSPGAVIGVPAAPGGDPKRQAELRRVIRFW